jgi:E3 ubiquitin-protein ligase DOA10
MEFVAPCEIIILPCVGDKHFFHTECIEEWANHLEKVKLALSCPICRGPFRRE